MKSDFAWDRLVQITHWLIALGCGLNLLVLKPGALAHQAVGYMVVILVVVRLLWAVTGARAPARLRDMIPGIAGMKAHLTEIKFRQHQSSSPGHNSFGLLFIWAAWGLLLALAATGYLAALMGESSLLPGVSVLEDFAYDHDLDNVHGLLANGLGILVIFHIVAVVVTGIWLKHNYVQAMIARRSRRD